MFDSWNIMKIKIGNLSISDAEIIVSYNFFVYLSKVKGILRQIQMSDKLPMWKLSLMEPEYTQ